ncbi:hypothetical protein UY416_24225 [Paenibacillus polymyxa]|uniref:hypothetical protein n=1 Tax=Paenibacillus polymyxa TaxID=1406 RepID=UPI002AB504C4|nr:hypothetical protein [Paenibacillus polymyxa]MDY8049403.1 hypothetical protein [Paenibacillus polymyxa]
MNIHWNKRMLNAAIWRLRRARRFLKLGRFEQAEYDILTTIVILNGTLDYLNKCKKTKHPRKVSG